MSPMIRGHFVPQVESAGRAKNCFDVLIWAEKLDQRSISVLDTVQMLRDYLESIRPQRAVCINLWVPEEFADLHFYLNTIGIPTSVIAGKDPSEELAAAFGADAPSNICRAAATALACDADLVVTENSDWYPFYREFENLNTLLGSADIIIRQSQIFVGGHDLPWSFHNPICDITWSSYYLFAEQRSLSSAIAFLHTCQKKNLDAATQDFARSFVYNRMPNICFTRDRLLFYEMQRAAAKRAKWERQRFVFEIGYHLNFYYVLLFGSFDHLAVLVNAALGLGLDVRDVAARGKEFLKTLKSKAPEIHVIFTEPKIDEFIDRISSLRHSSAHRSQVMPGPVYEELDRMPTVEELDAEIRAKGLDRDYKYFPEGLAREWAKEMARFKLTLSKRKVILEDAVLLQTKKINGFINPLNDTEWNFAKFLALANTVFEECTKRM